VSIVEFDSVTYGYGARQVALASVDAPGNAFATPTEHSVTPATPTTSTASTAPATSTTPDDALPSLRDTPRGTPNTRDTHSVSVEPSQRPALAEISLTVEPGEFLAVIGANGSGKSTLAKHINALLVPQSGRVLTLGLDTAEAQLTFEIRSHAGMVFQNPDSQMVTSVVADDVAFGPENLAVPHLELIARVDAALDAVKMAPFAQRNPARLSGGQKQRVCIAGVLAMKPDILILDEPGAMLDARGRRGIRRIVRELNETGMTVILITHFMEEAVLAERVLVIHEGRIALMGSPLEVFSQKRLLRELALDVPFSLLLAEELRTRGVMVSEIVRPDELENELWNWYSTR
jgi:energy-coupling factor transporter ATPase